MEESIDHFVTLRRSEPNLGYGVHISLSTLLPRVESSISNVDDDRFHTARPPKPPIRDRDLPNQFRFDCADRIPCRNKSLMGSS